MPKDIIDVIDTTIKIGFGTIIAGVSTYIISHHNHKKEKSKFLLEHRIKTIEESVDKLEDFFNAWSGLLAKAGGVSREIKDLGGEYNNLTELQKQELTDVDDILLSSMTSRSYAVSRFRLLGANKVVNAIDSTFLALKSFRDIIEFDEAVPKYEIFLEFKDEFISLKKEVQGQITNFYSTICS